MHDCRGILQTPGWLWAFDVGRGGGSDECRYVFATVMGQREERQLLCRLFSLCSTVTFLPPMDTLPFWSLIPVTPNIVTDVNSPAGWYRRFQSFPLPLSFTDGQNYPRVRYCVSKHLLLSAAIHLSASVLWFCYPETHHPLIVLLKEVDPSSAVLSYNDNEFLNK